ncbi:hypothetical protein PINS_up020875 [Pythium insidiosum]|nr:hypothetical protein PINS_up020875 [Pythium insidiosum]
MTKRRKAQVRVTLTKNKQKKKKQQTRGVEAKETKKIKSLSTEGITTVAPTAPPQRRKVPSQLEYTISDLWPGEVYQFVVAAENRCGLGEFSPFSDYIKMESTAPDAPEAPTIPRISKRDADVAWIKPRHNGSEILQYTLRWTQTDDSDVSAMESVVLLTRSIVGTTYTLYGLKPGRSLRVWVAATNLIDNRLCMSEWSAPSDVLQTLCDVPDQPSQPRMTAPTAHSIAVVLTPPCDNGERILHYRVTLFQEELQFGLVTKRIVRDVQLTPEEMERRDPSSPDLSHTFLRLRGRTFYSATVQAFNAVGESAVSETSVALSTAAPTVPATIESAPSVSSIEPTRAVLRWTMPPHDGGSPIGSVVLQYSINAGPFEHEIVVFQGREMTLEQLKPKTTYQFQVTTTNSVGRASFSPPSAAFTTPSLVGFTIDTYFANRPPLEHAAARHIQVRVQAYTGISRKQANWLTPLCAAALVSIVEATRPRASAVPASAGGRHRRMAPLVTDDASARSGGSSRSSTTR